MSRQPLYVTRPSLPPLAELLPYLEQIWHSRILTNGGNFHQAFEAELARYLGVPCVTPVANATLGLMVALRQLQITGEVITTPFSFVATAHSIVWAGATPVFADIDPTTLNLDPKCIEALITPRTSAILAVHCYGQPCDVNAIEKIAARHGLKVLYDAAHAFGVKQNGHSILLRGDLSVLSFHATKVFNTFEGGAVISPDAITKLGIERLCNYGIVDEVTVDRIGLNAKMSEFNAAVGLLQLQHVDRIIHQRQNVDAAYRELLADVPGIRPVQFGDDYERNYYAFPILVGDEYPLSRDELYESLRAKDIYARRYFYPLISDLPMYRDLPSASGEHLRFARDASARVLCLPMFPDLHLEQQMQIAAAIRAPLLEPARI